MSWRSRVRRFVRRFSRVSGCQETCESCLTRYLSPSMHPNDWGRANRRAKPMIRRILRAFCCGNRAVFSGVVREPLTEQDAVEFAAWVQDVLASEGRGSAS